MPVGPVDRSPMTAAFFDAAARGEFLLRRCPACGTVAEPYVQQCPGCESAALDWVAASGGARVVSWSVVHGRPAADGTVPRSVVAIAELDEGPWWWAEIRDADADGDFAGQRLRICFEPVEGHEVVPVFRAG